ncbi:MAG: 50S ribosomal protein L15 [Cryomorphaceae bacterium]|nr:50S ribosomal protein L15 [Cryomorphaceae bacterium]
MSLHNLKPAEGSTFTKKRLGRGEGSGSAGTSGRGHKGAKSRSGYSKKIGFEGGQMPLQRRVPKFGFTNPNRTEYRVINLDIIQKLIDDKKVKEITLESLIASGLASKNDLVKVLGRGKISASVKVKVDKISFSAKNAIEKAGGSIELTNSNTSLEEVKISKDSTAKETKKETIKEAKKETTKEAKKETTKEAKKETTKEAKMGTKKETKKEVKKKTKKETKK